MTTLYHNPRCSKSRAALGLLRARGIEPEVVLYLENPPDARMLKTITAMLDSGSGSGSGSGSIRDLIRTGEALYRELGLNDESLSEAELLDIVAANPRLLQRPIVLHNGKAALGRPPENLLSIL